MKNMILMMVQITGIGLSFVFSFAWLIPIILGIPSTFADDFLYPLLASVVITIISFLFKPDEPSRLERYRMLKQAKRDHQL